jgi:hypothetical protein
MSNWFIKCDCKGTKVISSDKKCIYHPFPDGWSYTGSIENNSKSRGEVFTPLWV